MPVQKSLRHDNRSESLELIPINPFGLGRQPAPLVVVEPGPSTLLFPQDPDLLLKVFDDILLVTVDPSSETDEKQLERVHPAILYQPPSLTQIRRSRQPAFSWPFQASFRTVRSCESSFRSSRLAGTDVSCFSAVNQHANLP